MGKKRRRPTKPEIPTRWDMGAQGIANQAGLVIEQRGDIDRETGKVINPNGVKGARRVDMIEVWWRRGKISTAGYNAAERLRAAYEGTLRAPGWSDNDKVQSSVRPDVAVAVQIDGISKFIEISELIPASDRPIIDACVLSNGTPAKVGYVGRRYHEGLAELHNALERLSDCLDRKLKRR